MIKVGSYIICHNEFSLCEDFLKNQIGKVIDIKFKNDPYFKVHYLVEYDYVPLEIKGCFLEGDKQLIMVDHIYKYSNNREDLEMIFNSDKYNL